VSISSRSQIKEIIEEIPRKFNGNWGVIVILNLSPKWQAILDERRTFELAFSLATAT